jgi:tetratricopeptide (TPR) repeat protein
MSLGITPNHAQAKGFWTAARRRRHNSSPPPPIDPREMLMSPISRCFIAAAIVVGAWSIADQVEAAGSSNSSPAPAAKDSEYAKAEKAVKAKDYASAIPILRTFVAKTPKHADALNYLGYSYRKLGQFEDALAWCQKALAIDPDHKGANEYLGELYLQMDDLAKAEERLAHLDKVCFFSCEEFDDLKEAIAAFKKKS